MITFKDMEEDSLESYYVEGMEIPDGENPEERKITEGDDESKE